MEYRPILKLSDDVIGQIAAGEVVERPAAAVKELVENCIDAGATAITVELKDGGISSIRVSDNGRGIPAGQLRMAFERHATSKLATAEELFDVHTLGFRGEALASIAAVAKVTCTSRTADAEFGVRAQVEAGVMVSLTEAASPVGTTVVVRELFYNAPVRLKFLKKPAAEAGLVSDYILRLILSRPDVAFRFVNQGKTVYRSAGDGTLESALYCVYGREALDAMRPVRGARYGVLVEGYVGVGELSRGNRSQQSFFVNGRYFRDESVSKALESGCEGAVMIGRYPVCALSLTVPYRLVDVNVHPNKLEVRFQNPDTVCRAVEELTREALRTLTLEDRLLGEPRGVVATETPAVVVIALHADVPVPPMAPGEAAAGDEPGSNPLGERRTGGNILPVVAVDGAEHDAQRPPDNVAETGNPEQDEHYEQTPPHAVIPTLRETTGLPQRMMDGLPEVPGVAAEEQSATPLMRRHGNEPEAVEMAFARVQAGRATPSVWDTPGAKLTQERLPQTGGEGLALRYIGTVFHTYLLFEAGERLLLVDQHAAHERVLYDRMMERYQGTSISQRLLSPLLLRFTARDVALLGEIGEALAEAGFDLDLFDQTSVAVRAIPVILGENEPVRDLLLDVLDESQAGRGKLTRDRLRRRVAQMACKHAIKAGDVISPEDVSALLKQMIETGAQPTCPHGRPIVCEWSRRELEKRFKRIQ